MYNHDDSEYIVKELHEATPQHHNTISFLGMVGVGYHAKTLPSMEWEGNIWLAFVLPAVLKRPQ